MLEIEEGILVGQRMMVLVAPNTVIVVQARRIAVLAAKAPLVPALPLAPALVLRQRSLSLQTVLVVDVGAIHA